MMLMFFVTGFDLVWHVFFTYKNFFLLSEKNLYKRTNIFTFTLQKKSKNK